MTKLNLGCGLVFAPGFDNIDNSPSVLVGRCRAVKRCLFLLGVITEAQYKTEWPREVIWGDVSKRLRYANGSVTKIYSSHLLEHLAYPKAVRVLRECHRVLCAGGRMRLALPDLLYYAERYVRETREMLHDDISTMSREPHDGFLDMVCGGWLTWRRAGAGHRYMYDWPSAALILRELGFRNVSRCRFRDGVDSELAGLDNRPDDSLIVEAVR